MSNPLASAAGWEWVKSSYSANGGAQCLEWAPSVATASSRVPVRDSKIPQGPVLSFPVQQWSHFVSFAEGHEV
ncbi:DUF397 domain-containing protein [Streptomyces sp. NPDC000594]|uniref:DUF397 domain-containing protein n=1 Tax=Streptomyces sp. NPDC000594 TaxID=3154261 RepID=UPI0033192FEA